MTFKVTESGWYRTRDGGLAECVVADFEMEFPVRGYISNFNLCAWNVYGKSARDKERKYDLVEYLGKERPKQKKVVRMAPALILEDPEDTGGYYSVSSEIYRSEESAKNDQGHDFFVRWLIDTPYELTVEINE